MKRLVFLLTLWMGLLGPILSQSGEDLLSNLNDEDRQGLEALVLYPEPMRTALLESATHPEALVRIQGLQHMTQESFRNILAPYSQDEQEQFYELTRYPGLIEQLVDEGKKSQSEIKEILLPFPEEIHETALKLGRKEYDVLQEIHQLDLAFRMAFYRIKSEYPVPVQDALDKLLENPEVLDLMLEHMNLTVLVGDLYNRNPSDIRAQLDALQEEVAQRQAKELEDWKAELSSDPQALTEFQNAAESYADEEGYDPSVYKTAKTQAEVEVNFYYAPYPFWFGYPYWYAYPYWYPRPYWYNWGFYYGPSYEMVFIGVPSWHFMYWHYYYPYHFTYYPYLSSCYVRHYQHHRQSIQSLSSVTGTWVKETEPRLARDWLTDDGNLHRRFMEYGRLETDYRSYREANPSSRTTRDDYLQSHRKEYPELSSSSRVPASRIEQPAREPATRTQRESPPVFRAPEAVPRTQRNPSYTPPVERRETPVYRAPEPRQKPELRVTPPTNRTQQIDRARQYHQNTWQRSKTYRSPSPAPATPNRTPARQPVRRKN